MASSASVSSPKKGGTKHNPAKWDDERTKILLEIFESEIFMGNRPAGVFSKQGWKNVVKRFNEATGCTFNKDQLKNKQDNLRREYMKWENLIGKETGLGWDNDRRTLTAPDDWWADKAKVDPSILRYKDAGPVHLDLMQSIFARVTATGYRAYVPEYPDVLLGEGDHLGSFDQHETPHSPEPFDGSSAGHDVTDTNNNGILQEQENPKSASKIIPQKRKRGSSSTKVSQCDKICGAVEEISQTMKENMTVIKSRRQNEEFSLTYTEALDLLKGLPGMGNDNPTYWKGVRVLESPVRRIAFGHVMRDGYEAVFAWLSTFPDF